MVGRDRDAHHPADVGREDRAPRPGRRERERPPVPVGHVLAGDDRLRRAPAAVRRPPRGMDLDRAVLAGRPHGHGRPVTGRRDAHVGARGLMRTGAPKPPAAAPSPLAARSRPRRPRARCRRGAGPPPGSTELRPPARSTRSAGSRNTAPPASNVAPGWAAEEPVEREGAGDGPRRAEASVVGLHQQARRSTPLGEEVGGAGGVAVRTGFRAPRATTDGAAHVMRPRPALRAAHRSRVDAAHVMWARPASLPSRSSPGPRPGRTARSRAARPRGRARARAGA